MDTNDFEYNPYTNPNARGGQEARTEGNASYTQNAANAGWDGNYQNRTPKPDKKTDLGTKLVHTVAIALVFGLVAGAVGSGVFYVGKGLFGNEQQVGQGAGSTEETESDSEYSKPVLSNPIPSTGDDTEKVVLIMDVSDLVKEAMPCTVAITNISETIVSGMWGQQYKQESESCGTGFLVEQDNEYLYIATNNHVVEGAKELTVTFSDDTSVSAEIKGQLATKDLAVVKVALADIPKETVEVIRIARLGDSNSLEVGEGAIAIGNALGYGQSVTTGVVSSLGRSVTVTDSSSGTTIVHNNLIQTSAAINPGNSGGPLFNASGEVIGINSVKYSDTTVEGIGYAIPISDAMLVIEKLISGETIEVAKAGYLGIQGGDTNYGVYVYKVVAGSAAEKAGIRSGDIITALDGNSISTMSQLKELLSYYSAGDVVELEMLQSNGNEYQKTKVKVTLGDASSIGQ